MTEVEARNVSVGDKVQWPDGVYGDVIEKGYNAFKVKWSDNQISVVWFDDSGGLRQKIAAVPKDTKKRRSSNQ